MKNWKHFRRKEWKGFFIEVAPVSWVFGLTISLAGSVHLYCISVGPLCFGFEYWTKRLRRALKPKESQEA